MATHRHDVLVIGAGNGGLATAARLRRRGCSDVGLIEPSTRHVYKPLQNYVGLGLADARELERPQASLIPDGVTWHRTSAVHVDPVTRVVTCADGSEVAGADVVLAPGMVIDWQALPGAAEAVQRGLAISTFDDALLERAWERIRTFERGTAVFTLHGQPASGRETALKPLLLACDHWRREGVREAIEVVLVHDEPTLHTVPAIEEEWRRHFEAAGVDVRLGTRVAAIDGDELVLASEGSERRRRVDLLHLLPPYAAAPVVAASGLDGPGTGGFVDVDPETLRHATHPRVWAIGDAAALGDARTGGALRKQSRIVVENIRRARAGDGLERYDGYTVAPVATGGGRLSFAEYDRSGALRRSLPVRARDELRAHRAWYLLDRHVLPQVYWHGIVRGRA
ncbi:MULTISPECIES: NAD(P)/FAD-dependent oxidoreductase [unclassified Agrococcus]|uniref:NAD(P)/FAD-dependent oxidoreductase n=1 Tax=unclassified Agrococcus TaxID=2615065 RepID=UPI003623AF83